MSRVSIDARPAESAPGFVVNDPIEGRSVAFRTDGPVQPRDIDEGRFLFPVDASSEIEAQTLSLDTMVSVYVRTPEGNMVDRIRSHQYRELGEGTYHLEISSTVKVYFRIEGPITFDAGADRLDIDLGEVRTISIGARSYHQRPAGTITTTTDPEDLMTAIGAFSSSVKTTRPEMAYPTLRGHPPLLEIGDQLSIPEHIEPKDTGITIEVPPEPRMIFPVASLAFYLGADLRPGEPPRIVTDDGFTYPLVTERWFEDEVARVLKQVLLLDSVVRTEGFYGNDLYERKMVEEHLDVDISKLYEMSLKDRLREYLKVDFEDVEEAVPRWVMTAYVPPTGEGAKTLPYLVNELAIIRNPRGTRVGLGEASAESSTPNGIDHGFLNDGNSVRLLVKPELFDDSVEHVWFGDHVPIGATKGTIEAFAGKLSREPKGQALSIAVVSNREGLVQEPDVLEETYRGREDLDYDIDTFVKTTRAELREILEKPYDFLHYIGTTSPSGLHAEDGVVDVKELHDEGVDACFIDADHSFEEAYELVKSGVVGGVGTVGKVDRDRAMEVGRAIARLLNVGFSIRGALDVIREEVSVGQQYVVVGDGSVNIAQSKSTIPGIFDVRKRDSQGYSVALESYPAGIFRIGSTFSPTFKNSSLDFLLPGMMDIRYTMTTRELRESTQWTYIPVRINNSLHWNPTTLSTQID